MNESYNSVLQKDIKNNAKRIKNYVELYNKKIVITGATGLIGSVICKSLLCANRLYNCNITVYAVVRNTEKAEQVFAEVLNRTEFNIVKCNFISEPLNLKDNINYIIHTAAVTTSKLMVQKPVDTLMTAINGTKAILDMAKEKDLESIVYLSSMEVYGSFNDEKYVTEDTYGNIDILDVRSSYSEGKRVCENMCISYYHQYNIPVKIARLAQTFGPGISKDDNRVYAQFARSVLERKDIVLHTEGLSEGNYVYISDAVDAIIKLLILGQNGEAYNIANEQSHMQIRKMAEMVAEKVAKGNIKVAYELQSQNAYAKDTRMKMNTDKIKKIGWNIQNIENIIPNTNVILIGSKKFINDKVFELKERQVENLEIIACYNYNEVKNDMKEIVSKYDGMLNTLGINKI